MIIKSMACRYFIMFICFLIGPPIVYCFGIVAGLLGYALIPLVSLFWFLVSIPKNYNKHYRNFMARRPNNKSYQGKLCSSSLVFSECILCLILVALWYALTPIGGALAMVAAALLMILFYIVCIILACRMFFVQCCKSKKT